MRTHLPAPCAGLFVPSGFFAPRHGCVQRWPVAALALAAAIVLCPRDLDSQSLPVVRLQPALEIQRVTTDSNSASAHAHGAARANSFGHIAAAIRLSGGGFIIAEDEPGRVLVLDAKGAPVRSSSAPLGVLTGFRHILFAGECSRDSAFVWDFMRDTMTIVSAHAEVARRFRPQLPPGKTTPSVVCNRAGVLAFHPLPAKVKRVGSIARGTSPIFITNTLGDVTGLTDSIPSGEMVLLGAAIFPRPDGPRTVLAVTSSRLIVGTADSAVFEVYGQDGKWRASWRPTLPHIEEPSASREARDIAGSVHDPVRRQEVEAALRGFQRPNSGLPYRNIFWDGTDLLWIAQQGSRQFPTRLVALDSLAQLVAIIEEPLQLRVFDVGRGYLIASYEAPDGTERLQVFTFRLPQN